MRSKKHGSAERLRCGFGPPMLLCFVVPCIRPPTHYLSPSLSHTPHTHDLMRAQCMLHSVEGCLPSSSFRPVGLGAYPPGEPSRQTKQFENGWTVGALPDLPARWILCAPPLQPNKLFDRQSHRRIDAGFRKLGAVMLSVRLVFPCHEVLTMDRKSPPPCPSFRRELHLVSRSTLAASSRNPSWRIYTRTT